MYPPYLYDFLARRIGFLIFREVPCYVLVGQGVVEGATTRIPSFRSRKPWAHLFKALSPPRAGVDEHRDGVGSGVRRGYIEFTGPVEVRGGDALGVNVLADALRAEGAVAPVQEPETLTEWFAVARSASPSKSPLVVPVGSTPIG